MLKNFRQLKQFLVQHYPELNGHIEGELFQPPLFAIVLEKISGFIQIFALISIFLGDSVWSFIPFLNGPPEFYFKLKENPVAGLGLVFFILPSIVQSFTTTGAFEVIVDGVVVFSKLEQGRMPNGDDILNSFTNIVGLTQTQ